MKTTTLKFANLLMMAILLVGAVACNDRVPTDRPLITAIQDDNDDDKDEDLTRPDGQVFFKTVCGCNNTKNILVPEPTCNTFCAGKNTGGRDRLYLTFDVGPEISLNQTFKNVEGWCTAEIAPSDVRPVCELTARYLADSDLIADVTPKQVTGRLGSDGNGFFFDFVADDTSAELPQDTTFLLTLRVTSDVNGQRVSKMSDSVQIRKIKPGFGPVDPGPIGVQPVSQYACINKIQQTTTTGSTIPVDSLPAILAANQLHFYFIEQFRPDPIPEGFSTGFCHNIIADGPVDRRDFARLFETTNALALWRRDDPKMLNIKTLANSGTGWSDNIDAEDIIVQKIQEQGASVTTSRFFGKFSISSGPTVNTAGNSSNAGTELGFYMRLFIDQTTTNNFAKCPKAADYAGSNPLFRAIGEVVQVDTEGIYLAKREEKTYTIRNSDGSPSTRCVDDDYLIVKETDMRNYWFYFQGGVAKRPGTGVSGELLIKNNTMNFYYPFRPGSDPTVRQVDQKLYTIVLPANAKPSNYCLALNSQANGGGRPETPDNDTLNQANNFIPPHDKRFGCIPVSAD